MEGNGHVGGWAWQSPGNLNWDVKTSDPSWELNRNFKFIWTWLRDQQKTGNREVQWRNSKCFCETWVRIRSGWVLRWERCGKQNRCGDVRITRMGIENGGWGQASLSCLCCCCYSYNLFFPISSFSSYIFPSINNYKACRMQGTLYQAACKLDKTVFLP